jgi:hypothetical protein
MDTRRVLSGVHRIDLVDEDGEVSGRVMFDLFAQFVLVDDKRGKSAGAVYVPAVYRVQLFGGDQQPSLMLTYEIRGQKPVCVGTQLEAKPDGRQILRKDLDDVGDMFHDCAEIAFRAVLRYGEQDDRTLAIGGRVDADTARQVSASARKRGKKDDPDFLQEVAELYRDNVDSGPWAAIEARFGCAQSTAGRYVQWAREAGYLPKTEKGVKKA